MTGMLSQTALHDWHVAHGGKMVDFGGWSMPVQYTSIVSEHHATRTAAGLFDVSHMGRFEFRGPAAAAFLDRLCTRRVADLSPGQIRYSLMLNEAGGILDDVLVYYLDHPQAGPFHWMVVNASNRPKIAAWIEHHLKSSSGIEFTDRTHQSAMIAVQGPSALSLAQPLVPNVDLAGMKYYTGAPATIADQPGMVSRTGYTGEDGCELTLPATAAQEVWQAILDAGRDRGALPVGLGARDTLRLEAAMPLYGHELSEEINGAQTGLGFAINLKDRDFIGRAALTEAQADPALPKRVGLEVSGKRVPRQHCPVIASDSTVGEVTSGTFSPTLDRPIAMAYVRPSHAALGTELSVDIRGQLVPARVVKLPFYSRPS